MLSSKARRRTNSPPIANDDIYSTTGDATLNIPAPGVLSNDDDSDGDDLTVIVGICTQPSNGTVTVNQDGSFGYTPNPGFRGDDSFTYEASDGVDKSNTATVNITVNMTGFEQIISRLDNIESKVNKLDIEAFQMPSKTWCTYHISASIGGLPVEIELEQAYAVRQVAPMQFEEVFNFANTHSFGDGHIRVLMDMPDDFDAVLFQFVFVNPDTGLHGTIIIPHEYGDVWEKAKND